LRHITAVGLGFAGVCALASHLPANSGGFHLPHNAAIEDRATVNPKPQTAAIEIPVVQTDALELIACPSPRHHDGDAIRCGSGHGKSMRLYAIDAPEMPGACRPGRWCVPGDPYASRDHLASLTAGRSVAYRVLSDDRYRRHIVQAFADGVDLSCAMVRDGYAIERYGKLRC